MEPNLTDKKVVDNELADNKLADNEVANTSKPEEVIKQAKVIKEINKLTSAVKYNTTSKVRNRILHKEPDPPDDRKK